MYVTGFQTTVIPIRLPIVCALGDYYRSRYCNTTSWIETNSLKGFGTARVAVEEPERDFIELGVSCGLSSL